MPIYTFRCRKCDHKFNITLGFHKPKPEKCPKCEEKDLIRIFHSPNVIYRSGGFQTTDKRLEYDPVDDYPL
jgi:putative FmdB family regulatory protein